MSPGPRPAARVHGTEDLLTLIPFLLGFRPEDSLVFVTMDDVGDAVLTGTGARLDLPTTDGPTAPAHAALDQVIAALGTRRGISIVLAGYGPPERVGPMVATARDALHAAGIPLREALRVADGRFWRLYDTDPVSRPADGVPFETATSPAAAAAVDAGLVALPDRAALAATLASVTGPARERMVTATVAACALVTAVIEVAGATGEAGEASDAVLETRLGRALQAAARKYLTQAQDSYRAGQPADDETAATLTVLFELPSLWEFAARATNGEAWQIEMWSDLVRRAEPDFAVPAACLLALSALQAGHGALARIAVDRALDADPHDRFAQMLDRAIAAGIDPDTVTALLSD